MARTEAKTTDETNVTEEETTNRPPVVVEEFLRTTLNYDLSSETERTEPRERTTIGLLRESMSIWSPAAVDLLVTRLLYGIGRVTGDSFWVRNRREAASLLFANNIIPLDKLRADKRARHLQIAQQNSNRPGIDPVTRSRYQRAVTALRGPQQ